MESVRGLVKGLVKARLECSVDLGCLDNSLDVLHLGVAVWRYFASGCDTVLGLEASLTECSLDFLTKVCGDLGDLLLRSSDEELGVDNSSDQTVVCVSLLDNLSGGRGSGGSMPWSRLQACSERSGCRGGGGLHSCGYTLPFLPQRRVR